MEIRADVTLPFPRDRVFATYRDRLADMTEYLPNIRSIRITERAERGDDVDLVNEWEGGGEIPAAVRAFLSESMLKWTDHATWRAADHTVLWRTDVHAFPGAVKSSGENRFLEIAGGTKLEIRGDLTVDATKIPGVPKLLAKTVSSAAEKMLVGRIAPNLVEVAEGVRKLLERERA